jgi:hypothetical protein
MVVIWVSDCCGEVGAVLLGAVFGPVGAPPGAVGLEPGPPGVFEPLGAPGPVELPGPVEPVEPVAPPEGAEDTPPFGPDVTDAALLGPLALEPLAVSVAVSVALPPVVLPDPLGSAGDPVMLDEALVSGVAVEEECEPWMA